MKFIMNYNKYKLIAKKEWNNLDAKEAFDSLDIDDYGSGDERDQDDIDYSAEAFNQFIYPNLFIKDNKL